MSLNVRHKHSSVQDQAPQPSDLVNGEIALNINANSTALYTKNSAGAVVKLAPTDAPVDSVFGRTGAVVAANGDYDLGELGDVDLSTTAPTNGQFLSYDGANWVPGDVVSSVDLGYTASATDGTVTNSAGLDATIPLVTAADAGLLSPGDKTKLDGIQAGAEVNAVDSVFGRTGAVVATDGDYDLGELGDVDLTTTPPSSGQVLSYDGANWVPQTTASAPVDSVFGRTGAVVATEGDYELDQLGDVDLTSSAPTSGQFLKYDGANWVPGSVVSSVDLAYTPAASSGTVTNTAGTDATIPAFTSTNAGLVGGSGGGTANYLRADGTWSAPPGDATDLGYTASATDGTVTSSNGTDATVPLVTGTNAGLMAPGDKTKLDGIQAGAEVNAVDSVFGRTGTVVATEGDYSLDQLGDVDLTTTPPTTGQILTYDGAGWVADDVSVPDPLTLNNLTVNTLLTAEHIHGNLAGSVYIHVKNTDTVQLDAGTPFYITGTVGASDRVEIQAADSSDPAKGPAVGLLETTLAVNGEGNGTIIGEIFNFDTATPGWSTNDELYVANGGGLTNVKPTSGYRQIVAYVGRIQASTGTLILTGTSIDPVAGSNGQIQFNDDGGFGADSGLTFNKTTNELTVGVSNADPGTATVKGDLNLDSGGTFATTIQSVTPTANRTISFPDQTGTVGLVSGATGNIQYNSSGALAGTADLNVSLDWTNAAIAYTGLKVNVTDTASAAGSKLFDLQSNGTSQVSVDSSGSLEVASELVNNITVGRGAGAISSNTAVGSGALEANTTGSNNTANGLQALFSNTTGINNTANGYQVLRSNTTGNSNTANGYRALFSNTTGINNTANGLQALRANTTGVSNTANGREALFSNTIGSNNTANGREALYNNTTGAGNVCLGSLNSTGSYAPVFDCTTENNRVVMSSTAVTNAYIQVAWTVVSDERDKTNFDLVPHGLDFVKQLNPVAFQFKESRDSDTPHGPVRYGFKAQDILALEGDDNAVIIDNENPDKLRYNGEALVPVLVNAIKELAAENAAMKARLSAAGI